ncbi:uncharacterized protein JCM15063_006456 [Sporobolomyces koalae]|uniref:uncharacterized protein n=1 Tax=Sporobolomyces koalae TaxID=500713 RepID=UPI003181ADBB
MIEPLPTTSRPSERPTTPPARILSLSSSFLCLTPSPSPSPRKKSTSSIPHDIDDDDVEDESAACLASFDCKSGLSTVLDDKKREFGSKNPFLAILIAMQKHDQNRKEEHDGSSISNGTSSSCSDCDQSSSTSSISVQALEVKGEDNVFAKGHSEEDWETSSTGTEWEDDLLSTINNDTEQTLKTPTSVASSSFHDDPNPRKESSELASRRSSATTVLVSSPRHHRVRIPRSPRKSVPPASSPRRTSVANSLLEASHGFALLPTSPISRFSATASSRLDHLKKQKRKEKYRTRTRPPPRIPRYTAEGFDAEALDRFFGVSPAQANKQDGYSKIEVEDEPESESEPLRDLRRVSNRLRFADPESASGTVLGTDGERTRKELRKNRVPPPLRLERDFSSPSKPIPESTIDPLSVLDSPILLMHRTSSTICQQQDDLKYLSPSLEGRSVRVLRGRKA